MMDDTKVPPPGDAEQLGWNDGLHFMMRQCKEDSARWFPKSQDLAFTTLAMAGEVGEVANLVKKIVRGSITVEDALDQGLAEEVVDVLIYLLNLMGSKEFEGTDWMKVWHAKRQFNEERFTRYRPQNRLPQQVLAEAGLAPEQTQTWQTPGEFAS